MMAGMRASGWGWMVETTGKSEVGMERKLGGWFVVAALVLFVGLAQMVSPLRADDLDADLDKLISDDAGDRVREAIMLLSASSRGTQLEAFRSLPEKDALGDVRDAYCDWLDEEALGLARALRPAATLAAVGLKADRAVPHLVKWLTTAKEPLARETLLYALGELGDRQGLSAVTCLADDDSVWIRFLAREAAEKISGRWKLPTPWWPGDKAVGLMAACRTAGNDDTADYWRKLAKQHFGDRVWTVMLAWGKPGVIGGWNPGRVDARGRGTHAPGVRQFDLDEDFRPLYAVCVLSEMGVTEVDEFFLWRMFSYVRSGGRVIITGERIFQEFAQRELLATTIQGGGVYGKIRKVHRWPRGPWDAIIPEQQERMPRFPCVDGMRPQFKKHYYGYRAMERGGVLLVTTRNVRPATLMGQRGGGIGRPEMNPMGHGGPTEYAAMWPKLLNELVHGPGRRRATVDWANEPIALPNVRSGTAFKVNVSVTAHRVEGPLTVLAQIVRRGDGKQIARGVIPFDAAVVGRTSREVVLDVDPFAEPGVYEFGLRVHGAGIVPLHGLSRELTVLGRYDVTLEAPAVLTAIGGQVAATIGIADFGHVPVPDGEIRMVLVDEDCNRTMAKWAWSWSGPSNRSSKTNMTFCMPPGLPVGQYLFRAEVGNAGGLTFGKAVSAVARPASFRFVRDFLWSEWGSYWGGENPVTRSMGLNTSYGWGSFFRARGFPYEYAVINPPFNAVGLWLGDYYLGHGKAHGQRLAWEAQGRAALHNGRALAVNMIEEVGIDPLAKGLGRQKDLFLLSHYRTIDRLNREAHTEISAWDQLPLARAQDGQKMAGWFHYHFRDSLLHMRTYWFREVNANVNMQPGMGAGYRSPWYDSMHNRIYLWKSHLTWATRYRTGALPIYGRTPLTWLVNMYQSSEFAQHSRLVWSSIAAGGRHIMIYAPGDNYGAKLQNPDGTLSPSGETYRQVIESVRPCEPVLCHTQNRISSDVMTYDWCPAWERTGFDPVVSTLFLLGVQPNESRRADRYKVVFFTHGSLLQRDDEIATVKAAVEAGTVLVITPGGDPALARAFGIMIPERSASVSPENPGAGEWDEDPDKTPAMGTQEQARQTSGIDLSRLSNVLEGVEGLRIDAGPGPATGVTPDSPLTYAGGAVYGRVGKGLVIYLNLRARQDSTLSAPDGLDDWVRLLDAILARAGARSHHRILDVSGKVDPRVVGYVIDTDDGTQLYLLVHATDKLNQSARSPTGLTARVVLTDPTIRAVYDINRETSRPIQEWDGRRVVEVPLPPGGGTVLSLIRDDRGSIEIRPLSVRAAAGRMLPIEIAFRTEAGHLTAAAHTVVADIRRRDGTSIPGLRQKGLLSRGRVLIEMWIAQSDPRGDYRIVVQDLVTGQSQDCPVAIRDADSASLAMDWVLDGPVLLGGETRGRVTVRNLGRQPLSFAGLDIRATDLPVSVELEQSATVLPGGHAVVPFVIEIPAGAAAGPRMVWSSSSQPGWADASGFVIEVPAPVALSADPLVDMKEPDVVLTDLTGEVKNHTTEPLRVTLDTALPLAVFPAGTSALRMDMVSGGSKRFRIPMVLTREIAREVQDRDLAMTVRAKAGVFAAEARARLLVNPWDVAPPVINSLTGGVMRVSVLNAMSVEQAVQVDIDPPPGFHAEKARRRVTVPAGRTASVEFPLRWTNSVCNDGIHAVPYVLSVAGRQGPSGESLVELRSCSFWWIGWRDAVAPSLSLDLDEDEVSPWAFDRSMFNVATPPEQCRLVALSTAIDLAVLDRRPPVNSVVLLATRVHASAPAEAEAEIVWSSGEGLGFTRSGRPASDTLKPGNTGFVGMVWLNGSLVINNRPYEADVIDEAMLDGPLSHGRLISGVNTLLVMFDLGVIPKAGTSKLQQRERRLPTLFVRLYDKATGKRIDDIQFDVTRVSMPRQ